MSLREKRGEAIDAEAALQPQAAKPGGRSRMDLANRLRLRKDRQHQGRTMYTGFVPPYNTQSRVFDANELRRAATQVCTQSTIGTAVNALLLVWVLSDHAGLQIVLSCVLKIFWKCATFAA
jgi:hypothetical protein